MVDKIRAINHVFTRSVIIDLIKKGSNDVFEAVVKLHIKDPETKTYGQIIREIYAYLKKEHRNEYYYTNTLLNELFLELGDLHSVTVLPQIWINSHIADLVVISDEGSIYEIKSDLDNYNRLNDQLTDFYKAFSKVSILVPSGEDTNINLLLAGLGKLGEVVGIYVLSEQDTAMANIREPKLCNDYLDHSSIFKLLRKREYENVLLGAFGEVPQVAPAFHFRSCLERFKLIPITKAQKMAFDEMKKRNKIIGSVFEQIQPEIRSIIYFAGLSRKWSQLNEFLQIYYKG